MSFRDRGAPSAPLPAPLEARIVPGIDGVPRTAWDALLPASGRPFLEWSFLHALETTGSAVPAKGWTPAHVTVWRGQELIAASPAYVKTHSMGEFLYNDFRWGGAADRFGVAYYPKLIVAVPFSPATGPRFLVRADESRADLLPILVDAVRQAVTLLGCSSVGVLFPTKTEQDELVALGFHRGAGVQFHWENAGYHTFPDYLARFTSKRRHMVKSEVAQPAKDGTTIRTVTGDALTPEIMKFASRCYEATTDKHAFQPAHLTEAFFVRAGETLSHTVEVVLAEEQGRPIAAAFNLRGVDRLYGRHWGAVEERRHLHFNVCYYHAVERCIASGISVFEPGAGGEHKLARGFEPTLVRGAHWFADPKFHKAMTPVLAREVLFHETQVQAARDAGLAFKGTPKHLREEEP